MSEREVRGRSAEVFPYWHFAELHTCPTLPTINGRAPAAIWTAPRAVELGDAQRLGNPRVRSGQHFIISSISLPLNGTVHQPLHNLSCQ